MCQLTWLQQTLKFSINLLGEKKKKKEKGNRSIGFFGSYQSWLLQVFLHTRVWKISSQMLVLQAVIGS